MLLQKLCWSLGTSVIWSRCSLLLQTVQPVSSSSTWLHCSRNGVSDHIATPSISMASSFLQQGNNLHQTCFLAPAAFPLCQLQCVGWHIVEMRGKEEGVGTESWLCCLMFWPAPSPGWEAQGIPFFFSVTLFPYVLLSLMLLIDTESTTISRLKSKIFPFCPRWFMLEAGSHSHWTVLVIPPQKQSHLGKDAFSVG